MYSLIFADSNLMYETNFPILSSWETRSRQEIDSLPVCSCCYALYDKSELQYVGQTGQLRQRIRAHIRTGHEKGLEFDEIRFLEVDGVQKSICELLMISAYRPIVNMLQYEKTPRDKKYYFPLLEASE